MFVYTLLFITVIITIVLKIRYCRSLIILQFQLNSLSSVFYLGQQVHKGEFKIKAWPFPIKKGAELDTPKDVLNCRADLNFSFYI